jgi:hypothetical protein
MKLGSDPGDKPATARMRYVFLLVAVACAFVLLAAGHLPTSRGATVHHPRTFGVSMLDCWGGVSTDWYRTERAQLHEYSLDITSRYSLSTRLIRYRRGHTRLIIEWDTPHHCDRSS